MTFRNSQVYGRDKAQFSLVTGLLKQAIDSAMLHYGFYAWAWDMGGKFIGRFGYGTEYEVSATDPIRYSVHQRNPPTLVDVDVNKDHPIPRVRSDPIHLFIRDQYPALGVPDVRARGKARVQQDAAIVVRHRLAQELATRVRHRRTFPLCLFLRVQVGGGPLRSMAHGFFVGSIYSSLLSSCRCLTPPSCKAHVSDCHGHLVSDCHSTSVQQALSAFRG